jgi:hypothetical protein
VSARSDDSEDERAKLARRYVWWQPPDATLRRLPALLCQIMSIGTARDYVSARELWGEEAFREALLKAPPGALDERSWAFWHRHFRLPERPMPQRKFDAAAS